MTIKRLLALQVGPDTQEAVLKTALTIAGKFGAHIDVSFIKHVPLSYAAGAGDEMSMQFSNDLLQRQDEDIARMEQDMHKAFEAFMRREGVALSGSAGAAGRPTASWHVLEGHPADLIGLHGGGYDLIVTGECRDTQGVERIAAEAALFATGRPVLIAPAEPPAAIGESVLIAWNRGAQAARAVHAAKALVLEQAKKVRIVSITTGAKQGPEASEIAENLRWHGIKADIVELSPDYRSVGEVLLAEADAIHADLLVMGAFSQSRLRQMILGGVTRYVFEHARLPVLMAH
jgi:nucleotide-binding universal stress UspA family protein